MSIMRKKISGIKVHFILGFLLFLGLWSLIAVFIFEGISILQSLVVI